MRNKVFQSRRGENGNCFQACLASILGTGLYDIPDFANVLDDVWFDGARKWLLKNVGVFIECCIKYRPVLLATINSELQTG